MVTKLLVSRLFLLSIASFHVAHSAEETSEKQQIVRTEIPDGTKILDHRLRKGGNYDRRNRPNLTGQPDKVTVSLAVKAFTEIKETNMEFQVFLYLRQEWVDQRLAHRQKGSLTLSGKNVRRIWIPNLYITNANEYEVFTQNQLALIEQDGSIYYSAYVRIKGGCQMDLVKFPMDVQKCSLSLESFTYPSMHMMLIWKEKDAVKIFNDQLAEFDIVNIDMTTKNFTYVSGKYTDLVVTFTFYRRMGFYVIQFYIPCIVMVSLSWISFWMDRTYIGERLSLGITTILTIVFLLGSSNSTMPRVSYPKAIDWYLLGSFIFVFATLVSDLLIYRLRNKTDKEREKEEEGKIVFKCKHGRQPQYVAEANGQVHRVITEEEEEEEEEEGKPLRNCCLGCIVRTKSCRKRKIDWGVVVNNCCRFMYPATFLLFNLIYWLALWFG